MRSARLTMLAALVGGIAVFFSSCGASVAHTTTQKRSPHPPVKVRLPRGCTKEMRRGQGLQRFVDNLRAGDRGCLPPGDYDARKLQLRHSGTAREPIVLRSADSTRPAALHGTIWVRDEANYVTIEDLRIVGASTSLPAVIVNGDHSIWNRDDVSNPPVDGQEGGICFTLGQLETWGYAGDTTIENSLIHDCGKTTNKNHGIYIEATTGRTTIRDNWIYRNGDRGIQLYPAARNVLVLHNVIDGNGSGVIFSGDGDHASSDNVVTQNIISNSTTRWNVESYFPGGAVGSNNVVGRNCVWASGSNPFYRTNGGIAPPSGFQISGHNVVQRPRFDGSSRGDLRLAPGSGCRGFGRTSSTRPGPLGAPVAG